MAVAVLSHRWLVQVPFLFGMDDAVMTETTVLVEHHPADSAAAERLWDALYLARAGKSRRPVAELEDAASGSTCRWPEPSLTLSVGTLLVRIASRPSRPPRSAWRALSWRGGSGPAVDSGGSPGRPSCGS